MTQFEDIPSVMDIKLIPPKPLSSLPRGALIPVTIEGDNNLVTHAKYLIMALSENEQARALAAEYELVYIEGDHGLYLAGDTQACNEYMLACWAVPELRRLFETLGLRVVT